MTLAISSELTAFAFFSFLTVVFLAQWFVNFFLTFFKASTSYGYFHYVSYGIFAHWFSLDQMFKFSVSFATEVEKNRPSHGCFNRGLRSTKDSKRATGHLSPPTNNVRDLKSLLLSWKTCILVHLNGWKCSCRGLRVVATVFVLYFFTLAYSVRSSLFYSFSGSFSSISLTIFFS